MRRLRPAFTIIEILISVLIISVSLIYVLKIYNNNREEILYINERNKQALSDSLFLTRKALDHHQDELDAYELLSSDIRPREDESREILKKIKRSFYIPDEIEIVPPPDIPGPHAIVNEIKLKGTFSSYYWRVRITSL